MSRASTAVLTILVFIMLIPTVQPYLARFAVPSQQPSLISTSHGIAMIHEEELEYRLGNISYFTPTQVSIAKYSFLDYYSNSASALNSYQPFTIIRLPLDSTSIDIHVVQDIISNYLKADDVFTKEWLKNVMILPDISNSKEVTSMSIIDLDVLKLFSKEYKTQSIFIDPTFYLPRPIGLRDLDTKVCRLVPSGFTTNISGPVLAYQTQDHIELYLVYRLYSDTYRTFLYGLYQPWTAGERTGKAHRPYRAADELGYNLIPVPSRLYFGLGQDGLGGQRVVPGKRAFGELHGPADSTANSIRRVEEIGCVIVGKTKTAAFAEGSRGNGDTVDEQYPFSARGDGWQSCLGSSSGSACAMGAYDWLDFTIGSDTGGSVRSPAAMVGLYGNRPTIGSIDMEGVIALSGESDTAGLFGREPAKWTRFIKAWYQRSPLELKRSQTIPSTLLLATDYLTQANPTAQKLVDALLSNIGKNLNMSIERIKLDHEFEKGGYNSTRMYDLLDKQGDSAQWWTWLKNGKAYYQDYSKIHDGQIPPVDPLIRSGWDFAKNEMNWGKYEESHTNDKAFKVWFNSHVLKGNKDTCSDSILVTSIGFGGHPYYREDKLNKHVFKRNTSMKAQRLCPLGGCVDYTIPIGQVGYISKLSQVEEQQPINIDLIAHPGCDFMLLDFVDKLAEADLIGPVKAGRKAF